MTPTEYKAIKILLNSPNPLGGAEFGEMLMSSKLKTRQAYARVGGGTLTKLYKKGWVRLCPVKLRHATTYVASHLGKTEYFEEQKRLRED